MNRFKTLQERREATARLLENEIDLLVNRGYNPIKKRCQPSVAAAGEISPHTRFIVALRMALDRITIVQKTRIDIKSIIGTIEKVATILAYNTLTIDRVSRKHIKIILEHCCSVNPKFSHSRYNRARAYLMMIFKELVEQEAITSNPVRDISKKPVVSKIKEVLSHDQRDRIDRHLAQVNPRFRQFIHLFFHSGGRKTELLQLKPAMVDLAGQKYRCVVKKGKHHREVERTIKSVAVPFWQFFLDNCPDDQFIFGPGFKPAKKAMVACYPTRCWQQHVKQKLGIDRDFYSLKHLHSTEIVDSLSETDAAIHNSHTSTSMVVNIYDTKQKQRSHERMKVLDNKFA